MADPAPEDRRWMVRVDHPPRVAPGAITRARLLDRLEQRFDVRLAAVSANIRHMPSRVRSLIWIEAALPLLADHGLAVPDVSKITAMIDAHRNGDSQPRQATKQDHAGFPETAMLTRSTLVKISSGSHV